MSKNPQSHAYWYGTFHYAVYSTDRINGKKMELFEHLDQAKRAAHFALWNSDSVSVVSLDVAGFTATTIYESQNKKRLLKCVGTDIRR